MENLFSNPIFWIIVVVIVLLILIYNNLNSTKNRVIKSMSTIDTYLQQRTTMIKTMLDNAINASGIESDMQTQIAQLRSGFANYDSASINDKVSLDNKFRRFTATAESYPAFQSIDLFKQVSSQMVQEEQQIGAARRQYNSNATSYNTMITSFPVGMLAKIFGFNEKFELFTLDQETRQKMTNADDLQTGAIEAAKRRNEQKNQ